MEPTIFVCLALGLGCLLLVADGTACLLHLEQVCVLNHPNNLVMVIIGSAMLIPITLSLYTAWHDHRYGQSEEKIRLLETGQERVDRIPKRVRMYLYASHFLSAWGDRMWAFAVPILLMEVFVDTLLPSALFSLVMYTTCIVAMPSVGRFLDRENRWHVMRFAIVLENLMIIGSSLSLALILLATNADGVHKPVWTSKLTGLFAITLVCGGVGEVLNNAQSLSIEKDWVVVLAHDDSEELSNLNSVMRRINLSCNILAPMAFGIIMDQAGSDPTTRAMIGAAAVGIWNLISMPLEYFMTKDIYDLNAELSIKEQTIEDPREAVRQQHESSVKMYLRMWREYVRHPIFLLSFAFCALYMTILDGGALNTAYLKWRGLPDSVLGASRGVGAIFGIVGTLMFPHLRHCMKRLERVAVVSIWLFWLCLVPIAVVFFLTGESRVSDYVMLGCMVVSRMWLWSTDLAETQILQEWIEPTRRGSINSMQTATYQFFYIMIQLMGIVFHDPKQFMTLVLFSLATVWSAAVGFSLWDVRYGQKRHLYVRPRPHFASK